MASKKRSRKAYSGKRNRRFSARLEYAEQEVIRWNNYVNVGDLVEYFGPGPGGCVRYTTDSKARLTEDRTTAVVDLDGLGRVPVCNCKPAGKAVRP